MYVCRPMYVSRSMYVRIHTHTHTQLWHLFRNQVYVDTIGQDHNIMRVLISTFSIIAIGV